MANMKISNNRRHGNVYPFPTPSGGSLPPGGPQRNFLVKKEALTSTEGAIGTLTLRIWDVHLGGKHLHARTTVFPKQDETFSVGWTKSGEAGIDIAITGLPPTFGGILFSDIPGTETKQPEVPGTWFLAQSFSEAPLTASDPPQALLLRRDLSGQATGKIHESDIGIPYVWLEKGMQVELPLPQTDRLWRQYLTVTWHDAPQAQDLDTLRHVAEQHLSQPDVGQLAIDTDASIPLPAAIGGHPLIRFIQRSGKLTSLLEALETR